jgi:hypothetical protein
MAGIFWGFLFFPLSKILRQIFAPARMEAAALLIVLSILGSAIWTGF